MKSVFLVSQDHDLYRQVEDVLVGEGATASSDKVVQLRDDEDRLLTVYGNLNAPDYDDVRQPAEGFRGAGEAPDLLTVTACVVECRWEAMVANLIAFIATRLRQPAWVLDGDGVVWPASTADPAEVRL